MQSNKPEVVLRTPAAIDGPALSQLVSQCPPLDENSPYCNLLQVSHFADTAVVADCQNRLVGAITGYLKPGHEDTLFIWQVAVHSDMRGQGLARRMVEATLARPVCSAVRYIETTVTPGNRASWALFESLARHLEAPLAKTTLFESETHFAGHHDDEVLCRIGPFSFSTSLKQPDTSSQPL